MKTGQVVGAGRPGLAHGVAFFGRKDEAVHTEGALRTSAGPEALTKAEYDRFWRDGYLVLPPLSPPEEVAHLVGLYDGMFARAAGRAEGDYFDFASAEGSTRAPSVPQVLNPSRYEPTFAETAFRVQAAAIARQLLGPRAELVFEYAMLKPPRSGGPTPWHQDEAFYSVLNNFRSITFWMPLQDVALENGCMRFVPGSHRGPLLEHRAIGNDPRVHGLEAIGVALDAGVVCPLPAGAATVHECGTLHAAGPNLSDVPRRAYAVAFGVKSWRNVQWREHPWKRAQNTAHGNRSRRLRTPKEKLKGTIGSLLGLVLR